MGAENKGAQPRRPSQKDILAYRLIHRPLRALRSVARNLISGEISKEDIGKGAVQVGAAALVAGGYIAANTPDAHGQIVRPDTRVKPALGVGFPLRDGDEAAIGVPAGEDAETVVVPPNAGVGEPPVEAVDIREAPANASIDLSPQNIEAVKRTLNPPVFIGFYPGKDEQHEAEASNLWLWYQAVAQIHGGIVAKSAKQLNARVNGVEPVRKFGLYGEANTGLVAPVVLDDWPGIKNTSLNIQYLQAIQKTEDEKFQLRGLVVIQSLDPPRPTDIGAITQNLLLVNERIDIAKRVVAELVGRQGIKDPEQLRLIIKDSKSEPNIKITTWSWRTVLGQVNALLEENPDKWTMSSSFKDFYNGYLAVKDDPALADQYIIDYFHLK